MRLPILAFLTLLCTSVSAQNLQLFESFTDHAVLQRNVDHPIWGWARAKKKVTVTLGDQTMTTKAGKDGRWQLQLPAMPAGGPHLITVSSGREAITLNDVYFGDVYLLSGQSNMEWRLTQSDPDGSRAKAIADPMIRELKVKKAYDGVEREHLDIDENYSEDWMVGSAEGIRNFSGVGSYFAHYVRKDVDVPIGLLHASWGGSRIEPWMSPEALGMDADEFASKNRDIMDRAGARGRKKFAGEFPGQDIPTEDKGESMGWLKDEFDDASWPSMTLPTFWEAAGYPNVDGSFYFRRTFSLTAAQASGKATLYLGAIDDGDFTYINGQMIGSLPNAYSTERVYEVKPGTLRAGENNIAIRVVDGGGGGGFSATKDKFLLETSSGKVSLAGDWKYNIGKFSVGGNYNQIPVVLYNAMIAPLKGYPLTGVLWYQGESNAGAGDAEKYADLMRGLVKQWRGFFDHQDLPFYWVQLANFREAASSPNEPGWAILRQSQTAATDLPLTGQAVIIDIGEAGDIHPRNKWEVGRRLSLHALKDIYGKEVQASSPMAESTERLGDLVIVNFKEVGEGLMIKEDGDRYRYLKGFTVKDDQGDWHFAQALLDAKQDAVIIANPAGTTIVTVRYAWANNPEDANLFSKEGLPVTPFEMGVE
ncbi:sialate O-acetylesterase [Neolewinella agarilytica]|uniref:sialate O-acetylesterase n=1 Tax=Neolewinella agarilytica TaxID=478744 RepID=UPI0023520466|nr:sialate O-acetylesterase [Neolewinella agarilytica]